MSLKIPSKVPKTGFYYHYKHTPEKGIQDYAYEVISVGFHTESDCKEGEESFVIYRPLYSSAAVYQASKELGVQCVDVRPLGMWMENVEKDGVVKSRFTEITDPSIIEQLEVVRTAMYV